MPIQINNVPRRVVYAASGTGPYAFTFEILAAGDIAVYRDDTLLTITTDYTVTIASNGTGSITLTAAPTGATQIAIVGNRTIQRTTDFTTGGDFFANTVNDELDQQTIFAQQNAEGLSRALQAPITDPATINMTLPRAADRAGKFLSFDVNGDPVPGAVPPELSQVLAISDEIQAVSAIDTEVTTVAGIDSDVTTVAGISAAVSGVAAISSAVTGVNSNATNINAVAADLTDIGTVAGIAADVTTVAGIAADIPAAAAIDSTDLAAVAAISADVSTVGGIAANVTTVAGISADVTSVAADATDIGTVAGAIADVSTVAGISANVTTVAGISADVTAVAADATDIGTVGAAIADVSTVAAIDAEITTVAGISADVTAVAADATDIGTVAANIADVSAVAAIDSDVTTVATNIADVTNFSDVYLGPKTSNPTTRNDSSALVAGDLYFNTAVVEMRVYTGTAWVAATSSPDTVVEYEFSATAGQTSYTFTGGYKIGYTYVWVNGVMLADADYTATNGTSITFNTALSLNDEVRVITFKSVGTVTISDISGLQTELDGKVAGQSSSVDGEIALFSGTGGKTIKRATTSGLLKASSGVIAAAVAGTDYQAPLTAGTDYQTPLTAGTDYLAPAAIGVTVQAYDADLTTWAGKTAPSGTVVGTSDSQTLTNKTLTDPAIVGTILEDVYTISDGAAFEIDPGNGSIQLITLGANRTPKATNFAAGEAVTLMVDDGSAATLTWTDSTFGGSGVVWKTNAGVAPTLNTTGYTVITLWKVGTQVYGARVGDA